MGQDETPVKAPEEIDGELVAEAEEALPPEERDWPKPWMAPFLLALSRLPVINAAARTARVGRATVYRHQGTNPDFAAAWDEAIEIAQDNHERVLLSWATTGVPTKSVSTRTRRKTVLHPDKDRAKKGELMVVEEITETVSTVGAERSAALLMHAMRVLYPAKWDRPTRYGFGQDPDAGPIRIDTVSEIDRRIAALGAELELLDRGRPVEADAPREITQ